MAAARGKPIASRRLSLAVERDDVVSLRALDMFSLAAMPGFSQSLSSRRDHIASCLDLAARGSRSSSAMRFNAQALSAAASRAISASHENDRDEHQRMAGQLLLGSGTRR